MASVTVPLTVNLSADLRLFYPALVLLYPFVRMRILGPDTALKLLVRCIRIKVS
jgi:hypothetical protein